MTHVLVLGGSGFIGSHVVALLLEQGCGVSVYSRGSAGRNVAARARWIEAPGGDRWLQTFRPELFATPIDAVVHMIAMGAEDAAAAADAFEGRCGRFLVASSADVYLAYGRFIGSEPGPPVPTPLGEESPLRSRFFPYRKPGTQPGELAFRYDKILAEQAVLDSGSLNGVVVRLPKVYGRGGNQDLATVYGFAAHPDWRWTHAYVENVAAALVFLVLRAELPDRIYNLGEERTPTVCERLRRMPPASEPAPPRPEYDFAQDLEIDSGRIRALGFRDPVDEEEGMRRTLSRRGWGEGSAAERG